MREVRVTEGQMEVDLKKPDQNKRDLMSGDLMKEDRWIDGLTPHMTLETTDALETGERRIRLTAENHPRRDLTSQ